MDIYNIDTISSSTFNDVNVANGPILTEPGVKYYISSVLHNSNKVKKEISNFSLNLILFIGFCGFISILLYVLYKDKHDPNKYIQQQRIVNKIVKQNEKNTLIQKYKDKELITDLPPYQNEFENIAMRLM